MLAASSSTSSSSSVKSPSPVSTISEIAFEELNNWVDAIKKGQEVSFKIKKKSGTVISLNTVGAHLAHSQKSLFFQYPDKHSLTITYKEILDAKGKFNLANTLEERRKAQINDIIKTLPKHTLPTIMLFEEINLWIEIIKKAKLNDTSVIKYESGDVVVNVVEPSKGEKPVLRFSYLGRHNTNITIPEILQAAVTVSFFKDHAPALLQVDDEFSMVSESGAEITPTSGTAGFFDSQGTATSPLILREGHISSGDSSKSAITSTSVSSSFASSSRLASAPSSSSPVSSRPGIAPPSPLKIPVGKLILPKEKEEEEFKNEVISVPSSSSSSHKSSAVSSNNKPLPSQAHPAKNERNKSSSNSSEPKSSAPPSPPKPPMEPAQPKSSSSSSSSSGDNNSPAREISSENEAQQSESGTTISRFSDWAAENKLLVLGGGTATLWVVNSILGFSCQTALNIATSILSSIPIISYVASAIDVTANIVGRELTACALVTGALDMANYAVNRWYIHSGENRGR